MTKSYFFYGVVDGEIPEDSWQVLHEHFERLMKEDTGKGYEGTEGKAVAKKEGIGG